MNKEEKQKLLKDASCFLTEAWYCLKWVIDEEYEKNISDCKNEILVLISKIRKKVENGG